MERLRPRALGGALVVLAGSALIFLQPGSFAFGRLSLALVALGALCAAESVIVSKLDVVPLRAHAGCRDRGRRPGRR